VARLGRVYSSAMSLGIATLKHGIATLTVQQNKNLFTFSPFQDGICKWRLFKNLSCSKAEVNDFAVKIQNVGHHATDTSCYWVRSREILENTKLPRNVILSSEYQEHFQGGYTAEYYNAAMFNLIRRLLHFFFLLSPMNMYVHLKQNQDINSGKHNSVRCGFHFKDRVLLPAYKQQICWAVRKYDSPYKSSRESFRTYPAIRRNILALNCYFSFKKDQACTCFCTRTWVTFSNVVTTRVDKRCVFYYKLWICSESTLGTVTFDSSM
jgi:hypothetical protein